MSMFVWRCLECGAEVYRAATISDELAAVRKRSLPLRQHAETKHPHLLGELENGVSYHVSRRETDPQDSRRGGNEP